MAERVATQEAPSRQVDDVTLTVSAAFTSSPVIFVSLLAVVILLCVRAWCGTMGVALSRLVWRMLDDSIVALFFLFLFLVVFRFKVIG